MVVTDVGIALMDETTRRIRRKFAWRDVREVRVSVFADDFFAIVAPDEYDALLACNRKTEAIVAMREMWKRDCLLYTSPSPRDLSTSRMPSSA